MKPFTFTGAVMRRMLADPETAETVRQWMAIEMSRDEREVEFAEQLANDFNAGFQLVEDPGDFDSSYLGEIVRLASSRVNWRAVARNLIAHFAEPRLGFWQPTAWVGSRN